jgi:MFS family permease
MLHWVKTSLVTTLTNSSRQFITKTVWQLSLVSLFTDMASEMLYPVMPVFLQSIGFSVLLIGILEGTAEAVAGLSKSYFGKMSDAYGRRLPFVQLGYGLSAISKPMMALFIYPAWIFFSRTIDRIGKGIRTGARDALLSDEATPATKGSVFGFHRSMDTFGAVLGPAIALAYLYFYPNHYKQLFYFAFIPGLLAIITASLVKEKKKTATAFSPASVANIFSFVTYWKQSPARYKKLIVGLIAFALFNSSDVFLLLKMKAGGLGDTAVIAVYIFYNLVYALAAYPLGVIADKIGLKKIFLSGLVMFSIVYTGFAVNTNLLMFIFLFFLYGLYAAATEGIAKAWISNIADSKDVATAIGTYSGFQSIAALIASSLAGFLWFSFGAVAVFISSAIAVVAVIVYLSAVSLSEKAAANNG